MSRLAAILILAGLPLACPFAEISTTDDTGQAVTLPRPAQRIISLAPHVTELLFSAGAGDRIVGTVQWSDYPAAAAAIPRIGDTYALDLERIIELKPDLAVAWQSGNNPLTVQRLHDLGLAVFISEPGSLEAIAADIFKLGILAGTGGEAGAARDEYMRRLEALRAAPPHRARPLRVFYQVWGDPIFTVNGEHMISEVIRLCGGENVFASLPALSTQISTEAALAANPEVIIGSGIADERPAWLDEWKKWPELAAAANNALYDVPPELLQRHSMRILDGAERVCGILRGEQGSERATGALPSSTVPAR